MNQNLKKTFQQRLSKWYKKNKRDYPWRDPNNRFGIVISEILLQKTNAKKVDIIFREFVKKYPDFQSILEETDDNLKNSLKYLGLYNQKVPILKEMAKNIIEKHNGKIPSNKEDLLMIKGIGDYISGAILCFAFNKRVPIIDGNFIRILDRIFNIKSDKKNPYADKEIWKKMKDLLPLRGYRNFNYAILDFAALICQFYKPQCRGCIMNDICKFENKKV